jgi:hypothetical protein
MSAWPGYGVGASPALVGVSASDTGIQIASGDAGQLLDAWGRISRLSRRLDEYSGVVIGTAGSLAPSWTGEAATAYLSLSGIVHAHFAAAAETSRTAATALARYSAELSRCQREGEVAVVEAERCLEEIKTVEARLRTVQAAESAAQGALSTALVGGATARAAGPAGVPFAAAAQARATAAQGALTGAQADVQVATRALRRAQDELLMWQARGRRAWEEAQAEADRATGTLQALTIDPPPLAGVAPIAPLVAIPPFAVAPRNGCSAPPGEGEAPLLPGNTLIDPIPEDLPWSEAFPALDPARGDGLIADPIPDNPPWREGVTGREPAPGDGTIADPAPGECGRHTVSNKNREDPTAGSTGESDADGDGKRLPDLYADGNIPTEAELRAVAEAKGWTLTQTPTGPPTYVDSQGTPRLKIKSGSARTPGSGSPHIEVRDANGQRTDPFGNPVTRRSPGNHYPYRP